MIEVALVLAVGAAFASVGVGWRELGFAMLLVVVVRPVSVMAVVRRPHMPLAQCRLVGWFGIRGIGSLFYLVFALTLTSATPLMRAYKRRR